MRSRRCCYRLVLNIPHRCFIAKNLPTFLSQVSPEEAVEYVLPLLNELAMDEGELIPLIFMPTSQVFPEEPVKEALALTLYTTIWWFIMV